MNVINIINNADFPCTLVLYTNSKIEFKEEICLIPSKLYKIFVDVNICRCRLIIVRGWHYIDNILPYVPDIIQIKNVSDEDNTRFICSIKKISKDKSYLTLESKLHSSDFEYPTDFNCNLEMSDIVKKSKIHKIDKIEKNIKIIDEQQTPSCACS